MQPRDELADRFIAEAGSWWKRGASVIAAVSGGPDSMALLHLLKTMAEELPVAIVAAHANHQFRGAESDAEAELVRRTAEAWGLPLETAELNVPAYIADTGMNTQVAAREKRYAFLKEAARRHGSTFLLLGHHAGDQAETVLMRVIRGTGPGGLAGIPYRRKEEDLELIRPLLRITKGELLDYCKRNGVPYAVDSSNGDRHYFRNAVRLDILPMLEKYNPRLQFALARLADMAAVDDDYMEAETWHAFDHLVSPSGKGFRFQRGAFCRLHIALQRRLIKLILSCSSNPDRIMEYRHVGDIVSALTPESPAAMRFDIGDGWGLRREYDEVYIGPIQSGAGHFSYIVNESTVEVAIESTGDRLIFSRFRGDESVFGGNHRREAVFDEALLTYPLLVRSRLPGDVMMPYGLNGSKKVQDMFVDAKVPRSRRDSLPLLADADGRVLWIPGMRRSRFALVSSDTKALLRISFVEAEN